MKTKLRKQKIDLAPYFPVGYERERELSWIRAGFICSLIYALIRFSVLYSNYSDRIYIDRGPRGKVLIQGAVMADFPQILDGCLIGFLIIIIAAVPWTIAHYNYHYRGSKSIYLMRRLPDHRDLMRRCVTIPLVSAALAAFAALILTLILFGIYHLLVPEEALAPDQWQKLWRDLL